MGMLSPSVFIFQRDGFQDFPGGPVAKTGASNAGVQAPFLIWELSHHMLCGAVPLAPKLTKSKKKKRKKKKKTKRDGSQVLEKDISWIVKLAKV